MFDTVAALGASGLKWWLIVGGLTLGVVVGAALISAVPAAAIAGLLHLLKGWHFWTVALSIMGLSILATAGGLLYHQVRSSLKIIHDFPTKGAAPRWHLATWKG